MVEHDAIPYLHTFGRCIPDLWFTIVELTFGLS